MRARKILIAVGLLVVVLLVFAAGTVLVFTNTDWGRERTRRIVLGLAGKSVHGIVRIDGLGGNLLTGATLRGVTITDSAGQPFVKADEIRARYTVRGLLSKRIYLDDVRIVRPVVLIDRQPGGGWNYDRIIPRDTANKTPSAPGYGSWIRLTDVTVIDGHITTRAPYAPDSMLTKHQRDSVLAFNLGPMGRQNIVPVRGGYQKVSEFREINGTFPLMRVADANDKSQIFDVATLRMVAEPFRPPSVRVVALHGRFIVDADSLYFRGIDAALPGSKLSGEGRYRISNNDLRLRLHVDPVATNDLLWIATNIPQGGTGALDFALDWIGKTNDYVARNAKLKVAGASIEGNLGITMTDTMVFHDTDLRITRLDTRTIAQLFPTLKSPVQGYLTGSAKVAGGLSGLQLDADMAFDDPKSGRTHVAAVGGVGSTPGVLTTNDLHVTLSPFRVALARTFMPTLPVGGTVTGNAVLNGSTATRLIVRADMTHTDVTGQSRVVGTGVYGAGSGGRRGVPLVNADVRLQPLSLATAGRFAPAAGLRGSVTGPVRVTGPLSQLAIAADLTTPDSGRISVHGTANVVSRDKAYDLALSSQLFDASTITSKVPQTRVTADATVRGTGISPETINAVVAANLQASTYDSVGIDSARVRLAAANGVLKVDTLVVRVPHASADVTGQFGLTAAHSGELHYAVNVDSLGAFSRFLPGDTAIVIPRPGILAERTTRARADSARVARATEVQRAINGGVIPPIVVDTPHVLRRNALQGAVRAQGMVRGNIKAFDLAGTLGARDIVAFGNSARTIGAAYTWQDALTPQSRMAIDAQATTVSTAGFFLDTIIAKGSYRKPGGTVSLVAKQGANRAYALNGDFVLNKDRNDVLLNDLNLRFDSTVYRSAKSSRIHFGPSGISIDSLDIRGNRHESGLFVDGNIPKTGAVDLRIGMRNFEIGDVTALLESDVPARGLVSLDARLSGTSEDPRIVAAFGVHDIMYGERAVPEVHGHVDYADQTLRTDVVSNLEGVAPILTAKGTIPINLALSGVTGTRVPTGRALDVRVDADSLPLDRMPEVTDAISNLRGLATAHFTVAGSLDKPVANGQILLENAGMKVATAGIELTDVAASVRLLKDTVVIDSIVARSEGPMRIAGGIGIAQIANPSLDLRVTAREAKVMDDRKVASIYASADVTATGRLNAPRVAGDITVNRGVIFIPEPTGKKVIGSQDPAVFAVLDTTVASNRELFPASSPMLSNLAADVRVTISRDVFVRSRDANVEVYSEGPLHLTVNNRRQRIIIDGVVSTDRGEYRFQSRRFLIRRGSAIFTNSADLNPILQATGEYEVQLAGREPLVIRIVISGTVENPRISLESDAQPPIPQSDLLSYLAFGRSSSSLLQTEGSGLTTGGSGGGNLVGRAAALAQQQVASAALGTVTDEVAGEAARSLGADVLNIQPADVSPDVGNFLRATQIEFGKYLNERTFLGLEFRPDPQSLKRPGFQLQHRLDAQRQYLIQASLEPRYLLREPTLESDIQPQTTSVFGLFLSREWRY